MIDPGDRWIGSYRYVVRAVLWVIYLLVVLALILWWVNT